MPLRKIHLCLPEPNKPLVTQCRLDLEIQGASRQIDTEVVTRRVVDAIIVKAERTIARNPVGVTDPVSLFK